MPIDPSAAAAFKRGLDKQEKSSIGGYNKVTPADTGSHTQASDSSSTPADVNNHPAATTTSAPKHQDENEESPQSTLEGEVN